ncbi:MAG: metal ABC transporter substrate-binding protein [Deltaproteobacteria bacterium]|nr:metal ABC transporter substrate-binding protein [Deltaproteobacteria bacterium]
MLKNKAATVVAAAVIVISLLTSPVAAAERLACASYPVWLFARFLTHGRERFEVDLVTNPATGCPHEFAPTFRDLERLTQTLYLVKNGFQLESYLEQALKVTPPNIRVIDAGQGVPTLSIAWGRLDFDGQLGRSLDGRPPVDIPNPHVFLSPKFAKTMAANITRQLKEIDPAGAALYDERLNLWNSDMEALEELITAFKQTRRGYKVITSHGFMDYLAQDLGLMVIADLSPSGSEAPPSAARLKLLSQLIINEKVSAILLDPQANPAAAKTLSAETKVAAAIIDTATSGPANPPLDYYQLVIKEDLDLLAKLFPANTSPPPAPAAVPTNGTNP